MFDPINFDGLTNDPQVMQQAIDALETYLQYAKLKREAMKCRLDGLITCAMNYESECEKAYQLLPQWARW